MHRATTAGCVTIVLALGACGGDASLGALADGRGTTGLVCGDASFGEGELATMPALATLPDEVRAAVDDLGEPAIDPTLDWRVAHADNDEVVLIRELAADEEGAVRGDTHGTARLAPIAGAPNIPDGSWFVWGGSTCSPRLAAGAGDRQADLRLAEAPTAPDTDVTLLVMERRCASGRSADGRIAVDELTLTDDQVRVRISVLPPPGDGQDCQGNPWTPFTLELGEPIGDRTVVDANLAPARALVIGADEQ